jgi:hopene-associated glycosyltransferase HpnB
MSGVLTASAAAALIAWLILIFARGGFWRARVDAHVESGEETLPKDIAVYAVVPARNEAQTIGTAMASLAAQRFAGNLRIFLVDDHSDDATVEIAREAVEGSSGESCLRIVQAADPPAGWTGKLNAMECGVRAALTSAPPPDYWLFTDADIRHDPDNLHMLVEKARRDQLALVSLMVRLRCASAWECILIPAFVFFFQKLYPFAWVNDPARDSAAAAGGCILLTHAAFARMGGLRTIHDRLIDDCSLAGAVKATGGTIWLGLTDRTESIRRYDTLEEVWSMVKRTAYTQLDHSPVLLTGTILGMLLLYIVPLLAIIGGLITHAIPPVLLGLATLALQAVAYRPTISAYGLHPRNVFTLPLAATLYTAMTADSAIAHARRQGGVWKGRSHSSQSPSSTQRARSHVSSE